MIVVINIVFLKKNLYLSTLKWIFFCLSLIFVFIDSHFLQS